MLNGASEFSERYMTLNASMLYSVLMKRDAHSDYVHALDVATVGLHWAASLWSHTSPGIAKHLRQLADRCAAKAQALRDQSFQPLTLKPNAEDSSPKISSEGAPAVQTEWPATEVQLVELKPSFLRLGLENRVLPAETFAEAQGLQFLCPVCSLHRDPKPEDHWIVCWFSNCMVPLQSVVDPGRWQAMGTSFETLTLFPTIRAHKGCGWHGRIVKGEVLDVID
jgi:hypothetical protein